jgi:hypothetical protein
MVSRHPTQGVERTDARPSASYEPGVRQTRKSPETFRSFLLQISGLSRGADGTRTRGLRRDSSVPRSNAVARCLRLSPFRVVTGPEDAHMVGLGQRATTTYYTFTTASAAGEDHTATPSPSINSERARRIAPAPHRPRHARTRAASPPQRSPPRGPSRRLGRWRVPRSAPWLPAGRRAARGTRSRR